MRSHSGGVCLYVCGVGGGWVGSVVIVEQV